MKSSIKVDFADGPEGLQPVIKVKLSNDFSDARDSLLQAFFQRLGGESSWLRVEFNGTHGNVSTGEGYKHIEIFPVPESGMAEMVHTATDRMTKGLPTQLAAKFLSLLDKEVMRNYAGEKKVFMPDFEPIPLLSPSELKGNKLRLGIGGNAAGYLRFNDKVMDENYVIGRVTGMYSEEVDGEVMIEPVNVTAFYNLHHFKSGTKIKIIEREYDSRPLLIQG